MRAQAALLYHALWTCGDVLDYSSHSPLGPKVPRQTSGKWRSLSAGPSLLPGLSSDHRGSVVYGLMNHTEVSGPVTMRQRAFRSYLYSTPAPRTPIPWTGDNSHVIYKQPNPTFSTYKKVAYWRGKTPMLSAWHNSGSHQSYFVYPGYWQDQNTRLFHHTLQQNGSRFALLSRKVQSAMIMTSMSSKSRRADTERTWWHIWSLPQTRCCPH